MAVSGEKEFEIKADPATVMAAIAAVERLPEWSGPHKSVEVLSTHDDGRPKQIRMSVSILGINDNQIVEYTFSGDDQVSWTLVESDQQNSQQGSYTLSPSGSGTKVRFELTIDPKVPLPGFLVKKAQKSALETASKGLTKFVESL